MKLSELEIGQCARIRSVDVSGSMRKRLQDIGFVRGAEIVCVLRSPLGDPTAYYINGALMALRESESRKIDTIVPAGAEAALQFSRVKFR